MRRSDLIERIKSHAQGLRSGADVRIIRGDLATKDVSVDTRNGNRDITVVANTAAIDCDNEVVIPTGANLQYLDKNRKVFVDHSYDYHSMVGGIRPGYPILDGDKWLVRFGVSRSELGDRILADAQDFGVGVSIGFDALEAGPPTQDEVKKYGRGKSFRSVVRKWHWIELSVTAMPCNVECQSVAVESKKRVTVTPYGVLVK